MKLNSVQGGGFRAKQSAWLKASRDMVEVPFAAAKAAMACVSSEVGINPE